MQSSGNVAEQRPQNIGAVRIVARCDREKSALHCWRRCGPSRAQDGKQLGLAGGAL
jgi:hypothetical protein